MSEKLSPNEEKVCLLIGNGVMTAKQIEAKSYRPMTKARDDMIAQRVLPFEPTEQQYVDAVFVKTFPAPLYGGDLQVVLRRMVKKGILTRELIGKRFYYKRNLEASAH